ncbi:MAG: hypothetical protein ACRDKB_03850 [Actinomycetota bacterium]
MKSIVLVAAIALATTACGSDVTRRPEATPSGPPTIQPEIVTRHAEQFDVDVPTRRAGSQEEQVAATYLLGHLGNAGYATLLDGVPVGNLVRSTNVIALPPGASEPQVVVVVSYDTGPDEDPSGLAIGVWLELARALRVANEDHGVSFAALGAEKAETEGGRLGSRRLVQYLRDQERKPFVIVLSTVSKTGGLVVDGDRAGEINGPGARTTIGFESPTREVFEAAGFEAAVVAGGADAVGDALLHYLTTGAG